MERGKLTYTPKTVLDRVTANKAERRRFYKQIREQAPEWLKEIWAASKRRGTDKLTMKEINAEIAAHHREQGQKKKIK